jgi:hypothetical protein
MGYNSDAVKALTIWLGTLVPDDGAILEFGEQQVNNDVPPDVILALLDRTLGDDNKAAEIYGRYFRHGDFFRDGERRVADAFRGSSFTYRCLDLVERDLVIKADLNLYRVPDELRGKFHLLTNQGTTEHVADQINAFRCIHDFTAPGGTMIHALPAAGYLNHGLFNYHPAFFVLLAQANDYLIEQMQLTPPSTPYSIPDTVPGYNDWSDHIVASGMIVVRLRKQNDRPFQLFTDAPSLNAPCAEPWQTMMYERYDLRIRNKP